MTHSAVERSMRTARRLGRELRSPLGVPLEEYAKLPPSVTRTWINVNLRHLTYSTSNQLAYLLHVVREIERNGIEGELIEAGCALGGTAVLTCSAKNPSRPLRVFDVFGMIPPPSDRDDVDMQRRYDEISKGESPGLAGNRYYAYEPDLEGVVRNNLRSLGFPPDQHHVSLIRGKVEDTLTVTGPVALANVDVDWYVPVAACLERVGPHISIGGTITIRAYSDWSGARTAADEYFERCSSLSFDRTMVDGQLFARRLS